MFDLFLFAIFPYIAVTIAIVGLIWRYVTNQFSYSSISSQFLESRQLFWGSVPWHYGITIVLIGHLVGILFPSSVMAFNSVPLRLYILEGTALALGILLLLGLVILIFRRSGNPRVRTMTTPMDVVLLVILLVQVATGIGTAIFYRWGTAWYVHTATPWFASLATLSPNIDNITPLATLTKIHAVNAFVIIGLMPFTRLVHLMSIPIAYLWRPYIQVVWNRRQPQR